MKKLMLLLVFLLVASFFVLKYRYDNPMTAVSLMSPKKWAENIQTPVQLCLQSCTIIGVEPTFRVCKPVSYPGEVIEFRHRAPRGTCYQGVSIGHEGGVSEPSKKTRYNTD
jgi:hypothetical protein